MADLKGELDWAVKLHKAGFVDEASEHYQQILAVHPNHAETSYLLGIIEREAGDLSGAVQHISVGVLGMPNQDDAQHHLALALEALTQEQSAKYSQWLTENLDSCKTAEGTVTLIRVLRLVDLRNEAQIIAEGTFKRHQHNLEFIKQYGALQSEFGRFEKSIAAYKEAYRADPENLEVAVAYASILGRAERVDEALCLMLEALQFALHETKTTIRRAVFTHLLDCFFHLEQPQKAVETFADVVALHPSLTEGWACLARAQFAIGNSEDAIETVRRGLAGNNSDIELRWLSTFYELKPIYRSVKDIKIHRQHYRERLLKLAVDLKDADSDSRAKASGLSADITSYFLPYQGGQDDKELQCLYGEMVAGLWQATNSEASLASGEISDTRIHVMFISEFVWRHTNWRMKRGWLKFLDRERFRVSCLHLGSRTDEMTWEIKEYADAFYHIPNNLNNARELIREAKPDVIFYPEVGMSGIVQCLASQRLAPVQCCGIGHPVTTGLPTMDYFVSGDLIEPECAEEHYNEKLIKLPGISFPYIPAPLPALDLKRSFFGLKEKEIVYLCLQSPQKYLPGDDHMYAEIAARLNNAVLVFLEGGSQIFGHSTLKTRLRNAFDKYNVNMERQVRYLPHLSPEQYQSLNSLGDIALDTPGWSGGNTTLEALYQNLPLVTLRGNQMRACVSAGILQLIEVEETVATNKKDYIEIAVRLGKDRNWRQQVAKKISKSRAKLETDMSCMRAMEDFLEKAVKGAEGSSVAT